MVKKAVIRKYTIALLITGLSVMVIFFMICGYNNYLLKIRLDGIRTLQNDKINELGNISSALSKRFFSEKNKNISDNYVAYVKRTFYYETDYIYGLSILRPSEININREEMTGNEKIASAVLNGKKAKGGVITEPFLQLYSALPVYDKNGAPVLVIINTYNVFNDSKAIDEFNKYMRIPFGVATGEKINIFYDPLKMVSFDEINLTLSEVPRINRMFGYNFLKYNDANYLISSYKIENYDGIEIAKVFAGAEMPNILNMEFFMMVTVIVFAAVYLFDSRAFVKIIRVNGRIAAGIYEAAFNEKSVIEKNEQI